MLKTLDTVIDEAVEQFENTFHDKPTVYSYAAGRVNLIGEHIDYNDGFVMPMVWLSFPLFSFHLVTVLNNKIFQAIPLYTVIVGKPFEGTAQ